MPFTIKITKPTLIQITINDGDDVNARLAQLLSAFTGMSKEENTKAFNGMKGNFIRAQIDAPGQMAQIQACWNLICDKCIDPKTKPKKSDATNYELPQTGSQKGPVAPPDASKAVAKDAIAGMLTTGEFSTWKTNKNTELVWFKTYEASLTYETKSALTVKEWDEIIASIWLLGKKEAYFNDYIDRLYNLQQEIERNPTLAQDKVRIRIRETLKRLVPDATKGRTENSILSYKGFAAEILNTLRTLRVRSHTNTPLKRIAVPKEKKKFVEQDLTQIYLSKEDPDNKLRVQDIDRTEDWQLAVGDQVKLYIEVKYDAHTAAHKHEESEDQLERYLAVVKNRTDRKVPPSPKKRRPAIALENEAGWLEIFTTRTARIYIRLGFWLIVGGELMTPENIGKINEHVWAQAWGISNKSLAEAYPQRHEGKVKQVLKEYFDKTKDRFPTPTNLMNQLNLQRVVV